MSAPIQSAPAARQARRLSRLAILPTLGALLALGAVTARGDSVTWTGATNNVWDTVSENWSGLTNFYANGDDAIFDLSAGGSITLEGEIAPNSTTVSAPSGTYSFQGGGITTGTLNKSGEGTLELNSNGNVFTGATTISGGTLRLKADAPVLPASFIGNGLVVHLDANDVLNTGANPANGSPVILWVNKVAPEEGGAGDFTALTAAGGVLGTSGSRTINGRATVHFQNSGILRNTTDFGSNATVMYVGRMAGGQNRRLVASVGNNWLLGYWGGNQSTAFWNNGGLLAGALDFNPHIFVGVADASDVLGGGNAAYAYVADGKEFLYHTHNAAGWQGPNGLALGGWANSPVGTEQSFGDVGEVLVFNRALTPDERAQMEQYLQSKWVGVLPAATAVNLDASGAVLELNDVHQTIGSLAGVGGSTVSLGDRSLTAGGNNANTTFSGTLTGTGSLVKYGTGTLTLNGSDSNTFSGPATANNGAMIFAKTGGAKAIGGDLIFFNGPSPDVYTFEDNQFVPGAVVTFESDNGDHGRLDLYGTTQTLAGIQTLYPSVRGVIQNREFGPLNTGNSTLVLNGSGNYTFNGFLRNSSGTVSLVKDGTGTQTLAGAQITYTGPTSVIAGTLDLSVTSGYASPTTVESGAVLQLGGAANAEHGGWTGNALTLRNGATLSKTNSGYDTLNAGNLIIDGTVAINIANNGANNQLFVGGAGTGLTGSGTINLTNTGTATTGLTLRTGANPSRFNGTLNVFGGVVNVGDAGGSPILENTAVVLNGANLNLGGAFAVAAAPASVKSLSGDASSGAVLGAQTLTLGTNNGSGSFPGVISGAGGIAKVGTGTQSLTGSNAYTGATAINFGTLQLDFATGGTSDIVAPASTLVGGGGTLEILGGGGEANTQAFNGVVSNSLSTLRLTPNGAASLEVALGNIAGAGLNVVGADTTTLAGVAVPGLANITTTTTAGSDDGQTRLGASTWNGVDWASTASDGVSSYVVQWAGTYSDIYNGTDGGSVAIPSDPDAEVRILESTTNVPNTLGANETINSLLMVAENNPATVNMMANTLTVGNGAAAIGAVRIASGAQSLTIGATANDGQLTAGTSDPSVLSLINQSAGSLLTVNAAVADNAGPGAVSLSIGGLAGTTTVMNGNSTYTGGTTIAGGTTLRLGGAATLGAAASYAGGITNGGILQFSSSANQTISGAFGGNGSLVKDTSAASVLTLSGTGIAFPGTTLVSNGTLELLDTTSFASPVTVGDTATLVVSNTANQTANIPVTLNDGATLTHNGQNAASQFWVNNSPVIVAPGAEVTLHQASLANVSGANKGAFVDGGLKGGGGGAVVTVNATNPGNAFTFRNNSTTYSGKLVVNGIPSTTVNAGSGISVGGCIVGLTNADIEVNGTLELLNQGIGWAGNAPGDFWMGALDGTGVMIGNFTAGGETRVRIGNTGNSGAFSGVIANGTGNIVVLTKLGAGTQTLTGINTYTGNTTVSGGTLALGSGGALAFRIGANNVNTRITGSATLSLNGELRIDLTGAAAVSGNSWTLVDVGTLASVTYGDDFAVQNFSENSPGIWTLSTGGSNRWTFTEGDGKLIFTSGYATWASDNGIGGQASGDDSDNDSLTNGMEYALGLDPTRPDPAPGTLAGGVITFDKGADAIANGDVTYIIEMSTDLGQANPWTAVVTQTPPDASPTISYTLVSELDRDFVRLRISIP